MADNLATITVENNVTFKRLEDGRTEICLIADRDFSRSQKAVRDSLSGAGERLTLKVSKYRKRRSLNANAYLWTLIGNLAEALDISKDEIYRHYIKLHGAYRIAEISEDAAATMIHIWRLNGLGWIAERLDSGEHEGYALINFYYGSSCYNTRQMSKLINAVVEDCRGQGIETLPPEELSSMMEAWKKEKNT